MRITADTNVLVSATFWYGASYKIIEKVENGEIELVLSKEILEEFANVLNYEEIQDKIENKNLEMKRTVEKIVSISRMVEPKQQFDVVKDDSEDNKLVDCAFEGKVDYIISQDEHLLSLKEFKGIRIIRPEEFLQIVGEKAQNQTFISKFFFHFLLEVMCNVRMLW